MTELLDTKMALEAFVCACALWIFYGAALQDANEKADSFFAHIVRAVLAILPLWIFFHSFAKLIHEAIR